MPLPVDINGKFYLILRILSTDKKVQRVLDSY